MNKETKKRLARELRDANIRIFIERGSPSLHQDQASTRNLNLTSEEIRKKLKGGKYGRKAN